VVIAESACFCSPGAGEVAFTISRETLVGGEFGDGMTLDDYIDAIGLPSGGAVRASPPATFGGLRWASTDLLHNCSTLERFVFVQKTLGSKRHAKSDRSLDRLEPSNPFLTLVAGKAALLRSRRGATSRSRTAFR
jgi:hypothetical protein